jgi:hypothetical protein
MDKQNCSNYMAFWIRHVVWYGVRHHRHIIIPSCYYLLDDCERIRLQLSLLLSVLQRPTHAVWVKTRSYARLDGCSLCCHLANNSESISLPSYDTRLHRPTKLYGLVLCEIKCDVLLCRLHYYYYYYYYYYLVYFFIYYSRKLFRVIIVTVDLWFATASNLQCVC